MILNVLGVHNLNLSVICDSQENEHFGVMFLRPQLRLNVFFSFLPVGWGEGVGGRDSISITSCICVLRSWYRRGIFWDMVCLMFLGVPSQGSNLEQAKY